MAIRGVLCLFLMVPWVGLQCVTGAFPVHIRVLNFDLFLKNHPTFVIYICHMHLSHFDAQWIYNSASKIIVLVYCD